MLCGPGEITARCFQKFNINVVQCQHVGGWGYWFRRTSIGWQILGSPIYDGQIRVICVDYLLLSCMPVYMFAICIWFRHFVINDIFKISNLCLSHRHLFLVKKIYLEAYIFLPETSACGLSLAHQTASAVLTKNTKILWWQQLVYVGPPPLSSQNLEDRNFKSRAC
jgi:hypothetical protein